MIFMIIKYIHYKDKRKSDHLRISINQPYDRAII